LQLLPIPFKSPQSFGTIPFGFGIFVFLDSASAIQTPFNFLQLAFSSCFISFSLFFLFPVACFHYDVALFRVFSIPLPYESVSFSIHLMAAHDYGQVCALAFYPPPLFGTDPDFTMFLCHSFALSATPTKYYYSSLPTTKHSASSCDG
jgi:hypothetical protein